MSAFTIKLLAVIFMLIDHIGFAIGADGFAEMGFSEGYYLLRAVGRLALPLFAFLIANGFRYTRSVPMYALRLLAFAVISEVPFDLFASGKITLFQQNGILPDLMLDNVFFTLFIGLIFLWLNDIYKKKQIKYAKLISIITFVLLAAFAGFISADYGVVGVAWVALFGVFGTKEKKNILPLCVGSAVLASWRIIARFLLVAVYRLTMVHIGKIPFLAYFFAGRVTSVALIQPIAMLALGLIFFYNGKSGMPKDRDASTVLKYAFYAFYPLHLLLLYFIV